MTTTGELAEFVESVSFDDLPEDVVEELQKRVLDSVGIAVGAMGAEATEVVRRTTEELNAEGDCRLWGTERYVSPPDAAMYDTALVRYLDYMDSFLAPGETPHPSDNVAAAIACGESVDASGAKLLEGIGVAYEVQAALAWNAPVRDRGFDHVTHTVISAATAASKMLDLEHEAVRNAVGIAGTAHNALRVTRTGGINEWKGIASANAARNAVYSTLLARNGMEGPTDLFEGQKGWKQVIAGTDFDVVLNEGCTRVFDTMTKRYVAETYAQSTVEGIIELAERENIDPERVESIHLDTFHGAKLIIGGGEGSRYDVQTKAQADHSLPYMLAAALADREMGVAQYEPDRITEKGVQRLLRTVTVEEDPALTDRFEQGEMPAVIDVELDDGTTYHVEKDDFAGHPNRPMSWEQVESKFEGTTDERYDESRQGEIIETVRDLENLQVADLVALLD